MFAHTSIALLVLSIFYTSLVRIPSRKRVLLKSLRNARICSCVAPSARAPSIFLPTINATRVLRLRKKDIQRLPTGLLSPFILRIRFAISRARAHRTEETRVRPLQGSIVQEITLVVELIAAGIRG